MSNTRQAESPNQPPSGKAAPKAKKGRQRRGRGKSGVRNAKTEHLSPISKYLVKEEDEVETPQATDSAPDVSHPIQPAGLSSQHSSGADNEVPDSTTTTATTEVKRLESSGTTELNPKPPKAVKGHKDNDQREKRVTRESDNKDGAKGQRRQQSSNRSRARRERRVAHAPDDEYTPARRQVQKSIRDHFPVRRSGRKSKTEIEKEDFERTAQRLRAKDESGLKVVEVEGKGHGVVTTRLFSRGELVCEYSGELISHEEAKRREEEYGRDPSVGCYMYYFSYKTSKLCVDATADNGRKGRLLNHSRTSANVVTKLMEVDDKPYLCLVATRDISVGEELEYDYGERNKEALDSHPWLAT